ncbi:hypothetical protein F4818DRAFT_416236 [Hypoxylon cercidicola]|nr:hypothetical protein F4818DRAFT_416236 [Hypoxylon cercidicola]
MPILTCPNEVLVLIACELSSRGLFALRLTSRFMNRVTLPLFTKRYFEKRCVMLRQDSLESLLDISKHPTFGPALRTLTVSIYHLKDVPIEEHVLNRQAHDFLLEDQQAMMESGLNITYLSQSLAALVKLEAIVLDNELQPWGAMAQERQTGLPPIDSIEEDYKSVELSVDFVQNAIRCILLAITAHRSTLRKLSIPVGWQDGATISPDMLVFPRPCSRYLQSHPTSLTSLDLRIHTKNRLGPNDSWITDLYGFIALFPQLQEFGLVIDLRDSDRQHFPQMAQSLRLPHLRALKIGGIDCTEDELAAFLLGHREKLKEVRFWAVDIIAGGGSWPSLFRTMRSRLSLQFLKMNRCMSADETVYHDSDDGDEAGYLEKFEIHGRPEEWTALINGLMIEKWDGLHEYI